MNHNYFYRPRVAVEELKDHKHIILQSFDEKARDALTSQGATVARYALPQVEGPSKLIRGDVTITDAEMTVWNNPKWGLGGTWRNGSTFTLGEFVKKYHPHEHYFLHDLQGNRLRVTNEVRTFYLLRPNTAAKQWWTDIKTIHERDNWQGPAFVDNVGLDDLKIHDATDVALEYKGLDQSARYQADWAAFLDTGRLILGKRPIWVNAIGDWKAERDIDAIASRVDGMMLEAFSPWLNMRSAWDVNADLRMLQRVQKLTGAGKQVICVCHLSGKDVPERASYEYARYLLVHEPEYTSVRLVVDGDYGPITKVPEMALDLGKPLSSLKVGGKIVSRLFEHYFVSIDLETKKYSFVKQEPQPEPPVDPRDAQIMELQARVKELEARILEGEGRYIEIKQTVSELQTRLAAGVVVKF